MPLSTPSPAVSVTKVSVVIVNTPGSLPTSMPIWGPESLVTEASFALFEFIKSVVGDLVLKRDVGVGAWVNSVGFEVGLAVGCASS